MLQLLVLLATGAALAWAQPPAVREDCGPCDRELCPAPPATACTAGLALDPCGCCNVCAKREFESCTHPEAPAADGVPLGTCGQGLECVLRDDLLPTDPPEAHCRCLQRERMCGSDDVTYETLCQLAEAGITSQTKITVAYTGPCKRAATILTKPDNTKSSVGKSANFVCEAEGFPMPSVQWFWTRVDNKTIDLPGDDLHVAVAQRGGPEQYQVTGFLQVMEMKKHHEGDYTCVVQNDLGMDEATARLIVDLNPKVDKV